MPSATGLEQHFKKSTPCERQAQGSRNEPFYGAANRQPERSDLSRVGFHHSCNQRGFPMYHHVKKLMFTVRVDEPDPRFGNMLLEQFGGANGELAAAMQYSIQGLNCEDPDRKDLLMDIGTEALHLEVVGCSLASI
jgi:Manganese containing catalase